LVLDILGIDIAEYLLPRGPQRYGLPNEEEFLWRAADTKTLLNGTAALARMEF